MSSKRTRYIEWGELRSKRNGMGTRGRAGPRVLKQGMCVVGAGCNEPQNLRMGREDRVWRNRRGDAGEGVPEIMGGLEREVPASVTLGTGNVYCLWLPVCFQPLTSLFVSHQPSPTPSHSGIAHQLRGGNQPQQRPSDMLSWEF
jgi:hypothetical protein